MANCVNHPDRKAPYLCMKDNVRMCEECVHCPNPEIHCRDRTSCPIWFTRKERERAPKDSVDESQASPYSS